METKELKLSGIIKYHRNHKTLYVGTIEQLAKDFSYTLECGNSWNAKIKLAEGIKTIKALVSNVNKSYGETQGGCFCRDFVEDGSALIDDEIKKRWIAEQEFFSTSYTKEV